MTRHLKNLLKYIFPEVCFLCTTSPALKKDGLCQQCLKQIVYTHEEVCPLCSSEIVGLLDICDQCINVKRPWKAGGAPLKFTGTVREIIHKYKYNSNLTLSRYLVEEMTNFVSHRNFPALKAVTTVPMHWYKQFKRGFNQAELLAQGIAINLELPFIKTLKRQSLSTAQALKTRHQRQKNITHIFKVTKKQKLPDGAILLIDDVMTTGATLAACTKALMAAGSEEVYVLTAARG